MVVLAILEGAFRSIYLYVLFFFLLHGCRREMGGAFRSIYLYVLFNFDFFFMVVVAIREGAFR